MAPKSDSSPYAIEAPSGGPLDLLRDILGTLMLLLAVLALLALGSALTPTGLDRNWIGTFGASLALQLFFVCGHYVAFAPPIMVGVIGIYLLRGGPMFTLRGGGWVRGLGGLLILVASCALLALTVTARDAEGVTRAFHMGGLIGNLIVSPLGLNLVKPLGQVGASLLFGALSLIGLILFTERLVRDMARGGWFVLSTIAGWVSDLGLGELLPQSWRALTHSAWLRRPWAALGWMLGRIFRFGWIRPAAAGFIHFMQGISFGRPHPGRVLDAGADAAHAAQPRAAHTGPLLHLEVESAAAERTRTGSVLGGARRSGAIFGAARVAQPGGGPLPTHMPPGMGAGAPQPDPDDDESAYDDEDAPAGLGADELEDCELELRREGAGPIDPSDAEAYTGAMPDLAPARPRADRRPRAAVRPAEQATLDLFPSEFQLPSMNLLADLPETRWEMSEEERERLSRRIEQTLAQFKVEVEVVEVTQGLVITRFALKVAPGVRVNKILALDSELAMALKALHVRILAPIPGQAAVGIEVPNKRANPVLLKEIINSDAFRSQKSPLAFALGKGISGEPVVCDLAKMPHLLIAGTTGSGKSVCLNTIIASLLYRNKPDEVKFVMIDPKRVELSIYQAIPHLIAPVVSETKKAAAALAWCVEQMESRYKLLAEIGLRNLDGYNALLKDKTPNKKLLGRDLKFLPHIVIIIDELADLMMVARNEVEEYIIRLAQMARAVGIHLILATQRPSVNVITGIIKANFPSRIAFQVSSKVDSRTILDLNGAEALLGRGDMLFSPGGAKPFRIQGCFVSDDEVERLADAIREQEKARYEKEDFETRPTPAERAKAQMGLDGREGLRGDADLDEDEDDDGSTLGAAVFADSGRLRGATLDLPGMAASGRAGMAPLTPADMDSLSDEMLYDMALKLILESRKASVSYIQRRMKIGYARAGRIMDLMEERGIVGPYQGSRPRDLLVDPDEYQQ